MILDIDAILSNADWPKRTDDKLEIPPYQEKAYFEWKEFDESLHPRDERGRFGDGGGTATAEHENRDGMGDLKLKESNTADFATGSAEKFLERDKDGNYHFTAERQALHDKIVANALMGVPSVEYPTLTMMGGGSGSGKSELIWDGHAQVGNKGEFAMIDPDIFKLQLPEYKEKGADAARFTHEESSYLAKRVMAAAMERSNNILLDGTGDSSADKMMAKIDAAHGHGYKVNAVYATISIKQALERNERRYQKTGRLVPKEEVIKIHAAVSRIFSHIAGRFDDVKLYDTSTRDNIHIIASGGKGTLKIHDVKGFNDFLAKGKQ